MHIRLTFDPLNGVPIRDGDSDTLVQSLIDSTDDVVHFTTGTSNVIDSMRLAMAENRINSVQVTFIFNGIELINHGKTGIQYWPEGFCDHHRKRLSLISNSN